jgi:hypothetical protein
MEATVPSETAKLKHEAAQSHMLSELQNILYFLIWMFTRREFKSFLHKGFTTSEMHHKRNLEVFPVGTSGDCNLYLDKERILQVI